MLQHIIKQRNEIIIFILTFVVCSLFAVIGVDQLHDGAVFKPAVDVFEGKILYKETFAQYGAMTAYLQALALTIFGKYLVVIRLFTALVYGLIALFLYKINTRIIPTWLAFWAVIVWLSLAPFYVWTFLPWSNVYSLFFKLMAAWLFIKFIEGGKRKYLFYTGLATMLSFWAKQNDGIYLLAAFLFIIISLNTKNIKKMWQALSIYLGGCLVGFLPFIFYFTAIGSLGDWYIQNLKLAVSFGAQRGGHFNIFQILELFFFPWRQSFIWSLLPLVSLIGALPLTLKIYSKKINKVKDLVLWVLIIISLASWLNYFPVPCIRHCFWAATTMVTVFIYWLWQSTSYLKQFKHRVFILVIMTIFIFGYDSAYRLIQGWQKLSAKYFFIAEPKELRGLKLTQEEAIFYREIGHKLNAYFKFHPGKNLVNYSPDFLFGTFKDNSESFHPLHQNSDELSLMMYPDYDQKYQQYLKLKKPLIVSFDSGPGVPGYYNLYTNSDFKYEYCRGPFKIFAPIENVGN